MDLKINLYGFASGVAANDPDCGLGPLYLYYHPELWKNLPFTVEWRDIVMATSDQTGCDVLAELTEVSELLALDICEAVKKKENFCVIGGDHSSAIGLWSGVAHGLRKEGPLGLIWVDAHMDAHTPETSPSQNIHGMPISHLLGLGFPELSQLLDQAPKLKPEHLCLIGIRSFEPGEAALLERLKIKVFMMDEVEKRGLNVIFREALAYLHSQDLKHIGLTIDLDGFDPEDAPGVGYREAGGIRAAEFLTAVAGLHRDPTFIGLEITEYNPMRDIEAKTAQLIPQLIKAVYAS